MARTCAISPKADFNLLLGLLCKAGKKRKRKGQTRGLFSRDVGQQSLSKNKRSQGTRTSCYGFIISDSKTVGKGSRWFQEQKWWTRKIKIFLKGQREGCGEKHSNGSFLYSSLSSLPGIILFCEGHSSHWPTVRSGVQRRAISPVTRKE